ncbi:dynactin subunit 4-like [Mercenaria mercenaria]|uniref:dynactin subunit 4-like n=1 Tax=Mercenaria mercenaria TaxID=6596 RepID=UPI00234E4199|nr:dynactin subunit 4-like [Mercenaria mercenaria]
MAGSLSLPDTEIVKYLCACKKWNTLYRLYLCRHCFKIRCSDCVLHEVDSPYCPNCLENMPSAEAKLKKNRCTNCFDCPSCGHTLTTRATSQMVSNPDDPGKSTPKKMYYLACGFCRWTTRDVAIPDKPVASGAWEDLANPDAARITALMEYYQQLAQKEKVEKERKKYTRRRSHLMYAASMDKYGLVSVAAKRKGLMPPGPNPVLKEHEETTVRTIQEAETVSEFPPLSDDFFTQPVQLAKKTTISQRLASPEFQPSEAVDLYPRHKHLLIRRSLRCKECEHNLSKPEFNPLSIKFKIQLIALLHIPEIRVVQPGELKFKKDTKVVLTFSNPANTNTKIQFLQAEAAEGESVTAKIELPKKELILAHRDDTTMYDDLHAQQDFKDDSSVVSFRKANKLGVIFKVTPLVQDGDIKVCFILKHNYVNTAAALPSENQEPQIVWLEHRVVVNLGTALPSK